MRLCKTLAICRVFLISIFLSERNNHPHFFPLYPRREHTHACQKQIWKCLQLLTCNISRAVYPEPATTVPNKYLCTSASHCAPVSRTFFSPTTRKFNKRPSITSHAKKSLVMPASGERPSARDRERTLFQRVKQLN